MRPGAKVGGTSHSKNTADHAFTLQQLEHRDTEMDGTWQGKNIIEYFQLASEDWSYVKMFCIDSKMDGMPLCPSKMSQNKVAL